MYKLISATPSPYARKVRIALAEKSVPFTLVTEVPWNDDTATPQYNPLEKIPILIADDGAAYYESRFILDYIELKHPEPPLLPRDADGILAAKRLEVLADGVCDALVLLFFERMRDVKSEPWSARQQRKVDGGLREIARLVGKSQFCVGGRFGLGDIAVGSLLGWATLRWPELPWRTSYRDLAAFSDRLEQRPSFRDTVPFAQTITSKVA